MTGGARVNRSFSGPGLSATMVALLSVSALALGAGSVSAAVHPAPEPVRDSYIVTLSNTSRADVPNIARNLSREYRGEIGFIYQDALRGFSVKMPAQQAEGLSRNPKVARVEQDGEVQAVATQTSPPMGLDRIDRRDLPLDGGYDYLATGNGVRAYVIDTGIRPSHSDFGGRASVGFDSVGDGRNGIDCNGHGTHVAGTVGGSTYGVAKAASLVGVRVLNCNGSGTWSGVIAGIDWVTRNKVLPAVANMSLSGGASSSVDQAVANSISAGVTYAVAAGNGNSSGVAQDACNYSPARAPAALTISATDSRDLKASWANYGTCVDLFAPGVGIESAYHSSDTATSTMSGTSMASPHVAGLSAQYLQANPSATPAAVASEVLAESTPNKVQQAGVGSPNQLLFSGLLSDPGNTPPFAGFTATCSGLVCSLDDTSYDADGSISSQVWDFGDWSSGSGATVSHTYASGGTYNVKLTVTDNSGDSSSATEAVTVAEAVDPDPATPTLSNGSLISATSGAKGSWQYYKILVPDGKTTLKTDMGGSSPNLDLYVRRGSKPTTTKYSCRSRSSSSNESCSVSYPSAEWYYIGVRASSGSRLPYSLKSAYTP